MNLVFWIKANYCEEVLQPWAAHDQNGTPYAGLGATLNDYAGIGVRISAPEIVKEAETLEDLGLIEIAPGGYWFTLTTKGWVTIKP